MSMLAQKQDLPVAPFIIVGDTDAHGATLSAAIMVGLMEQGVLAADIAVHNHFNPKGLSTSARGDLVGYINALADAVAASGIKPVIFIADIPTPIQAQEEYATALEKLAKVSSKIIYIDTAAHGLNAQLPVKMANKGITNVEFRLTLSVPQTYFLPALMAPKVQVFDLAVLGTVLDMDIQSLHELNIIKELVEQAEEVELPPITVEKVRENMHSFVAFDQYLKFGRDWAAPTEVKDAKLWGNMAVKVAALAATPIPELYKKAIEFAKVPTVDEIRKATEVAGFVAVVKKEAPKGMVFNWAKLAQAGLSTPIVVAFSEGFQPGKKVLVAAPNVFEPDTAPLAEEAIKKAVNEAYEEFKKWGWSDEQDFPRGVGALTMGVKEEHLETAIKELTRKLNKHFMELDRAKYAAQLAKSEILALVADENLASTLASIIEKAVRAAAEEAARKALAERS